MDTLQDNLGRPNPEICVFLNKMQGWRAGTELRKRISEYLAEICSKAGFGRWRHLGPKEDKLHQATYRHKHQDGAVRTVCAHCAEGEDTGCDTALNSSCTHVQCDGSQLVARERTNQLRQSSVTTNQVGEGRLTVTTSGCFCRQWLCNSKI